MAGVNIRLAGDWRKAARILNMGPARIRLAMDRAVMQEAQFFRKKVVEGIREQAPGGEPFKPLAETTLAMRRFQNFNATKALIVRGDLRNSIKVVKKITPLGSEAFVGVLKSAKGKGGQKLVNIAEVHEFGSRPIVIEVTPAMRRFLAMVFQRELGGVGGGGGFSTGIIVTQIPARPYFRPVIDKWFDGPDAALRFQARVATNLGGMFGVIEGAKGVPTGGKSKTFFSTVIEAIQRSRK
jgi:hypothetical protein